MVKIFPRLSLKDRLNIELVGLDEKPLALVEFGGLNFSEFYDLKKLKPEGFRNAMAVDISEDGKEAFLREASERFFCLEYKNCLVDMNDSFSSSRVLYRRIKFALSKNRERISDLVCAENDREIGKVLGYPDEDIEVFGTVIDGRMRNGNYVTIEMNRAKENRKPIPSWIAYLSHTPKLLDICSDNYSNEAKKLGERYQKAIRKAFPLLAIEVDRSVLYF